MKAFVPTKEWIESLQVGHQAPNCFGDLAEVVAIRYRDSDVNGKQFVGVELRFGPTSTISQSYKEGELHKTTRDESEVERAAKRLAREKGNWGEGLTPDELEE